MGVVLTMTTRRRKRPSNNPEGRPSHGLSETTVRFRAPELLAAVVEESAAREGITTSEWWRRAARVRLGWREVTEEG